jgi:hypothetical protein
LGVGLTTLPVKKKIVDKPPRKSAIFNGRRLRRRRRSGVVGSCFPVYIFTRGIISSKRWVGHARRMTRERLVSYILVINDVEKKAGRHGCSWENDIKGYHRESGWNVWIGLIWLRTGARGDYCEDGNATSGSMRDENFF